jgi:YD repeat-containing protein
MARLLAATLGVVALASAAPAGAASASITYAYDPVGRVITARYDNNSCVVYAYDPEGNRLSQTNTASAGPETPTWGIGTFGCFVWTAQHAQAHAPDHLASSSAHGGRGGR